MTTWTTHIELRLLYGARAGFSAEHMAAVFGVSHAEIAERLRAICGGDPVEPALTAAIRARAMPLVRENRTSSREPAEVTG